MIGRTGEGKSTLCNAIAGQDHNYTATLFPVSALSDPKTTETRFADVFFRGRQEMGLVSLIDTVGFDGSNQNDTEIKIIEDLVSDLKTKCDHIHLFLIVVNGQHRRLDGSLIAMLRLFEELFGRQFWKNVVIIFTHLKMDNDNLVLRKTRNGLEDKKLAELYVREVKRKCSETLFRSLRFLFVDCYRNENDRDEKNCFEESMQQIYSYVNSFEPISTREFVQHVNRSSLKQRITQKESAKRQLDQQKLVHSLS